MKKIFRWFIVSVVLVVGLSGLTAYSAPLSSEGTGERTQVKDPVKVVCENGIMLGQSEEGVISFKGVPFAKPPTGKLRWKAPQAPDPSGDEIRCYDFGYTALQSEWPSEPASYFPKNEDCLTLNIWENKRVMDSEEPKPVMVFFHGGAYGWGGTTDPMYNGQNFAKAHDDVILVTCNYRLGLMAFPDFSKIEGGEDYTDINLALRDQIAALQWIKKNIAGFGGNPDNVTIFGESAGSWSVTALAISPKVRGLFRRVIAQSGEMVARDRKEAQKYADFIMKASGARNMKELLAVSGDEWMKLDSEKGIADACCYIVIDEDIIPKDLDKAFKDAAKSGVQMIMGSNSDEWNYFKEDFEGDTEEEKLDAWGKDMDAKYNEAFGDTDKEGKAALEELIKYEESIVPEEYAGNRKVKEALVKSGLVSEMWRYEILDFADRFADAGGDIRVYLWKVPSTRENMYKSAVHAVELAYVFNNLKDDIYAGEVDPGTAAKVQEAWVNFAGTGDPSVKGVLWKKYNTGTRDTMVIEKDKWECVSDPSKKTRELLKKAYGDKPYYVW
ncbi:MAG: carboxylesterase family protein [Succiniclasticum sp.]|uniref:carboxylesterase/lipase family protein n=1 Tax=Succiniclasticum sp. TaxID=2775030 RepID=UPI002A91E1A6|nr:carboxylesterase family protein [Succiniclasticum sp.]MDY6290544.1 carboxylesterase family protein [Succiniclasticum sp.]